MVRQMIARMVEQCDLRRKMVRQMRDRVVVENDPIIFCKLVAFFSKTERYLSVSSKSEWPRHKDSIISKVRGFKNQVLSWLWGSISSGLSRRRGEVVQWWWGTLSRSRRESHDKNSQKKEGLVAWTHFFESFESEFSVGGSPFCSEFLAEGLCDKTTDNTVFHHCFLFCLT